MYILPTFRQPQHASCMRYNGKMKPLHLLKNPPTIINNNRTFFQPKRLKNQKMNLLALGLIIAEQLQHVWRSPHLWVCAKTRAQVSPAPLEEGGREVSSSLDTAGSQELSPLEKKNVYKKIDWKNFLSLEYTNSVKLFLWLEIPC